VRVYHRQVPAIPFEWHHHPECELTLTLNSRGWRFVGDHIGRYDAGDLVLVPSGMPHTWASSSSIEPNAPQTAIVIWFSAAWISRVADLLPEYACLNQMLRRADRGLVFPPESGAFMQARLASLLSGSSTARLQATLEVLCELAGTDAAELASYAATAFEAQAARQPLARVLANLHERFAEPIRASDLCAVANVSSRTLHRLFVRHVGETVTDYLTRLRIGRACMLLIETELPIRHVAEQAGFPNLSNFNRLFLKARGMTPKRFRTFVAAQRRIPGVQDSTDLAQRPSSLERRPPARRRPDAYLD